MKLKKKFIFILFICLISFVSSYGSSNENYSVNVFVTGLQSSDSLIGNYNGTTFLNVYSGQTGNANSTNYFSNIGPIGKFLGIILNLPYCGDGTCNNGETCSSCVGDCGACPVSPGGGGGSTTSTEIIKPKCSLDSECGLMKYCSNGECYNAECFENKDCSGDKACWEHRCVKLFDVKIINFSSPVKLGEFFEFSYFLKGMAKIENDVKMNFWIEQDGKKISEGSDVIYVGNFEEKTENAKLFIPKDIQSGNYKFYTELDFNNYKATSYRTISILVKGDEVEVRSVPLPNLTTVLLIGIMAFLGLIVLLIFLIERRQIKKALHAEGVVIKKHKITTTILFSLLGLCLILFLFFRDSLSYLLEKIGYLFQSTLFFESITWIKAHLILFFAFVILITYLIWLIIYSIRRKMRYKKYGY